MNVTIDLAICGLQVQSVSSVSASYSIDYLPTLSVKPAAVASKGRDIPNPGGGRVTNPALIPSQKPHLLYAVVVGPLATFAIKVTYALTMPIEFVLSLHGFRVYVMCR